MIRRIAGATALALLAALPHATAPQAAQAGLPLFGFPKKSKPPVVLLAEMIDDLEESLNDTGTIVAKKPDVWGESRLTKHREDVEGELACELGSFTPVLSGTSAMTDQAFLANALAIQAAIGPQGRIPTWTSTGYQFTPANNAAVTVANVPAVPSVITLDDDDDPVDVTNSKAGPIIVGTAPGGFPLSSALRGGININEENLGFAENGKLTLEPTVRVDQLKRYLDHLNELRRLNEGSDTADAPGYSLNLVRIPVSVMPGDDTRKGHGAEITVTAEMHLTRELLPTTFRSMVIQDLMDELSLPVVKLADVAAARIKARNDLDRAAIIKTEAEAKREKVKKDRRSMIAKRIELAADSDSLNKYHCSLLRKMDGIDNFRTITEEIVGISIIASKHPDWNEKIIEIIRKQRSNSPPLCAYFDAVISVFGAGPPSDIKAKQESLNASADNLNAHVSRRVDRMVRDRINNRPLVNAEQYDVLDSLGVDAGRTQELFSFYQPRRNKTPEAIAQDFEAALKKNQAKSDGTGELNEMFSLSDGNVVPHNNNGVPVPVNRAPGQSGHFDIVKTMRVFGEITDQVEDKIAQDLGDQINNVAGDIQKAIASARDTIAGAISDDLSDLDSSIKSSEKSVSAAEEVVLAATEELNRITQANIQAMASTLRPGSPTRRSRLPIPPTQIACVFGENELLEIANRFQMATHNNCTEARLSEARAFLKEELEAAYDYLRTPAAQFCWDRVPEIAMAVRTGNEGELARLRLDVVSGLCASTSPVPDVIDGQCSPATCGILALMAWPILVEAALLDQRLNEDLLRVSQDPECECMVTGPQCFYLPDPPEEARMAFMDYVRCRWPIHVFALDPQTQDQNVAQASSIRRELQLAAALAFASGRVGASNTLRFVRRLELEEQAIALNRTAIAFAHGANTFGWRFRPRFQTMDIESNAVTVGRDLLWGGPNRDARMKNWRIEPGMRECVALVVMPSFVPHVRFDVRSHWFKLHNHDNIKGEMTDTMKLSSKIAEAQQLMEFCHLEAENYRPGEIERLYARVKQLSDRLPLQTMYAQVPYENTAGGFELFSSGVTDLGPELLDFYGAPGVSRSKPTTLFLVGRNFSVHNSVVIAGNRTCEKSLLSRDVMQVTIPAGSQTVFCSREGKVSDDPCAKCRGVGPCGAGCYEAVEIHLATPYGVSGQLFVPVYQEVPVAPSPEPAGPSPEEITAGAVDAAKKLVQGHQAVFHPVTYAWSKPAVKATYLLDTCGRPSDLCLHVDSLAVVPSGATPFGPHQSLSFAARVEAVDSKGKVVAYQSSIAPSLVSMANSTFPLYAASGVAGPHFAAQLATVVANEPELTLQASKLRVHGFVQIGDPTLPPVQLTNVLEIEIGARSVGGVGVAPCPTCPSGAATGAASFPIGENVGHVHLPATNSGSLSVSEAFMGRESGSVTGPGLSSESTETRVPSATGPEIPTVPTTPTPGLSKVFLPPNTGAPEISEGPRFE